MCGIKWWNGGEDGVVAAECGFWVQMVRETGAAGWCNSGAKVQQGDKEERMESGLRVF